MLIRRTFHGLAQLGILVSFLGVCCAQQVSDADKAASFQELRHGYVALAQRKFTEAIAAFKKANKLRGNACDDCYLGLATTYLRQAQFKEALENCERALAVASGPHTKGQAHNLRGNAFVSMAATDPGKLKQAEAEFRAAMKEDTAEPLYRRNLGVVLLKESRDAEGIEELKAFVEAAPDAAEAAEARLWIADPRRVREEFAPDFTLTTQQGETLSLKGLAGKVIVLDFCTSSAPGCAAEVSDLKAVVKKYSREKLVLISVSEDKEENAWKEYIAKKEMDWPQYRDADGQLASSFRVSTYPAYVVIDEQGIVHKRIIGNDPQDSPSRRLRSALDSMPQLRGK